MVRSALRYSLITLGIFVIVYALLFAQNAAMTLPSLTAQFNKASYETVLALIDGNYTTGNFGPPQERLDLVAAFAGLDQDTVNHLANMGNLQPQLADKMIENVIGTMNIPIGIATNVRVDGEDVLIPMATEES